MVKLIAVDGLFLHRGILRYDTPDIYASFGNYVLAFTRETGQRVVTQLESFSKRSTVIRLVSNLAAMSSVVLVVSRGGSQGYKMAFAERLLERGFESKGELIIHLTADGYVTLLRLLRKAISKLNGESDQRERIHSFEMSYVAPSTACLTVYGAFKSEVEFRSFAKALSRKQKRESYTAIRQPFIDDCNDYRYRSIARRYAKLYKIGGSPR